MEQKYKLGDKVKFMNDADSLAGVIVSFSYDASIKSFRYSFTSKAFDVDSNSMIEGIKTCLEAELLPVESAK